MPKMQVKIDRFKKLDSIPSIPGQVLKALNVKLERRNLSFLDGKNVITNKITIKELDILFKKII